MSPDENQNKPIKTAECVRFTQKLIKQKPPPPFNYQQSHTHMQFAQGRVNGIDVDVIAVVDQRLTNFRSPEKFGGRLFLTHDRRELDHE